MKLLVADDHTLFCDILKSYFESLRRDADVDLVHTFDEAYEMLESDSSYDLVILDLCMPGMNGFDGLKKVRRKWSDLKCAIISGVAERWEVRQALEKGACAFFPKSMSGRSLIHAIDLVLTGEKFAPADYVAPPEHPPQSDNNPPGIAGAPAHHYKLTPRERDVLKYLIRGASNKTIADGLKLKVVTIKLHVRSICRKLGAHNRTQAALFAREQGLARDI
jgi:DNA-binding NarL/FixJ family response regulator